MMNKKLLLAVALAVVLPSASFAAVGFKDAGGNSNQVADIDCYPDAACSQSGSVATIDSRYQARNVYVFDAPADTTGSVTVARTGGVFVLRKQTGPSVAGVGYTASLPTATAGLTYTFTNATNVTMSVKTAGSDVIRFGNGTTRLTSPASSGATVTVVGNTGGWYVTHMTGGFNGTNGPSINWTPATS